MLRKTFGNKKNKSYEDIHYSCMIRFLDDSEPLSVTYQKETKGDWLIDDVCKKLDLEEKDYFGLRYVDSDKQRLWLDPLKPIYKKLKQVSPPVLCFRVKFYPTDPTKLKEEITRYNLFLQLRRDLHHGRLLCSPQDASLLAAYIIQSEVGDYDPEEHQLGYVSQFKMLPKQTAKQEEKIAELHKTLTGLSPAQVEIAFLKKTSSLDTYGVDPHPVKDQKGNQMYLGVTHLGIVTFQGNKRTHLFKWSQVTKIAFEGKMFIVHVTISEDSENDLIVKKKKHACGFKCPTFSACKNLWKCAVEQQYFFTLEHASEAPRVTSGGGWFSRGSRFRFSGRCQREVYSNSESLQRDEPSFERCVSNPSVVKSYNQKRSDSLPGTLKGIAFNDSNTSSCLEDSTQSLIAGEVSFGGPANGRVLNGSATSTTTIHGLPRQDAVEVSDRPYEPLASPSREDLLCSSIQPIPEDSILGGSEADDSARPSLNGKRPELLPRYSQLDTETCLPNRSTTPVLIASDVEGTSKDLLDSSIPIEPLRPTMFSTPLLNSSERTLDSGVRETQPPEAHNQTPLWNGDLHGLVTDTQLDLNESFVTADGQFDETPGSEIVTKQSENTENQPDNKANPGQNEAVANHDQVSPASRIGPIVKSVLFTMLWILLLALIFGILLMETSHVDLPLLSDMQQWPSVQNFKYTHYVPLRAAILQKTGLPFGKN